MKFKIILIFLIIFSLAQASIAQTNLEKGISFFKQKKYKEAVKQLKRAARAETQNAEAWNYLGLSFLNRKRHKDSVKAFRTAVELDPQNSSLHSNLAYAYLLTSQPRKAKMSSSKAIELRGGNVNAYLFRGRANLWLGGFKSALSDAEKVISLRQSFADAYLLKANALLFSHGAVEARANERIAQEKSLLLLAIKTLRDCVDICAKGKSFDLITQKLQNLSAFENYYKNNKQLNLEQSKKEGIKITNKPRPGYTNRARSAGTQGKIVLAVLFVADGTIGAIAVLKGLGNGLNENCIKAARKIKFVPAKVNGEPISVVKRIQYSFTIY